VHITIAIATATQSALCSRDLRPPEELPVVTLANELSVVTIIVVKFTSYHPSNSHSKSVVTGKRSSTHGALLFSSLPLVLSVK